MVDNGGFYDKTLSIFDEKTVKGETYPKFRTPSYFLWSNMDGSNNVILSGGQVKTVDTYWTGLSAWNDSKAVSKAVKVTIDSGKVPFIHVSSFSDKGQISLGNCKRAINFDEKIAKTIGNNFAFVNIETEWDKPGVVGFVNTTQGMQCFIHRISVWRTFAPKTVLMSSPGLWAPEDNYSFFSNISAKLDIHANLQLMTNNAAECTWRVSGGSFTGGKTLDQALLVAHDLKSKQDKMSRVWKNRAPFVTADAAITACGWGSAGQARILSKIVDNMCELVRNRGWHGMNLRNYSPDPQWRTMGQHNEGMFPWSQNSDAKVQIQRGLDKAIHIMRDMKSTCKGTKKLELAKHITVMKHSNDNSIRLVIEPSENIKSVVIYPTAWGTETAILTKSIWSNNEWVTDINKPIPNGSEVTVVVERDSGRSIKVIQW
jgi:hypothetical protein